MKNQMDEQKLPEDWAPFCLACYGCGGTTMQMCMMSHRDKNGKIVGWLFSCENCFDDLRSNELEIKIKPKKESGEK